jgi:hypothetical protein
MEDFKVDASKKEDFVPDMAEFKLHLDELIKQSKADHFSNDM